MWIDLAKFVVHIVFTYFHTYNSLLTSGPQNTIAKLPEVVGGLLCEDRAKIVIQCHGFIPRRSGYVVPIVETRNDGIPTSCVLEPSPEASLIVV